MWNIYERLLILVAEQPSMKRTQLRNYQKQFPERCIFCADANFIWHFQIVRKGDVNYTTCFTFQTATIEFLIKFNKSYGIVVICYMLFFPKLFSNLLEFAENISNCICVGATSVVPHCPTDMRYFAWSKLWRRFW